MSSRPLHRRQPRPPARAENAGFGAVWVPPFHQLFPMPNGFGPQHPFYEIHRAANRAYRDRLDEYRRLARSLAESDLAVMIREDVISNVLAVRKQSFGPLTVPSYVFLSSKKLRAWRPAHQKAAQALVAKFGKYYQRAGGLL